MPRQSPKDNEKKRVLTMQSAPYDTTGMDPAMRGTLKQEKERRERVRKVTSPWAQAADDLKKRIAALFGRGKKKKKGK